jgi:hypothetical protein
MAVNLSPIFVGQQFLTANAQPLSGGKINTYQAGTSTPQTTYTDSAGSTPNNNPIILDSTGRPPSEIWLTRGQSYKFVLTDSLNNVIVTLDNITGINDINGLTTAGNTVLGGAGNTLNVGAGAFTVDGGGNIAATGGSAITGSETVGGHLTAGSYITAGSYATIGTNLTVAGTATLGTAGTVNTTADGRLYGSALHNNANPVTGKVNQYVASGTYTPTLTTTTNCSGASAFKHKWMRVGNVVHVSGQALFTITAANVAGELDVSLPIATTLATYDDLMGVGTISATGSVTVAGKITANVMQLQFNVSSNGLQLAEYVFQYEVL